MLPCVRNMHISMGMTKVLLLLRLVDLFIVVLGETVCKTHLGSMSFSKYPYIYAWILLRK